MSDPWDPNVVYQLKDVVTVPVEEFPGMWPSEVGITSYEFECYPDKDTGYFVDKPQLSSIPLTPLANWFYIDDRQWVPIYPDWDSGIYYGYGDRVTYNNQYYHCERRYRWVYEGMQPTSQTRTAGIGIPPNADVDANGYRTWTLCVDSPKAYSRIVIPPGGGFGLAPFQLGPYGLDTNAQSDRQTNPYEWEDSEGQIGISLDIYQNKPDNTTPPPTSASYCGVSFVFGGLGDPFHRFVTVAPNIEPNVPPDGLYHFDGPTAFNPGWANGEQLYWPDDYYAWDEYPNLLPIGGEPDPEGVLDFRCILWHNHPLYFRRQVSIKIEYLAEWKEFVGLGWSPGMPEGTQDYEIVDRSKEWSEVRSFSVHEENYVENPHYNTGGGGPNMPQYGSSASYLTDISSEVINVPIGMALDGLGASRLYVTVSLLWVEPND